MWETILQVEIDMYMQDCNIPQGNLQLTEHTIWGLEGTCADIHFQEKTTKHVMLDMMAPEKIEGKHCSTK